jgi:RNA polymerase sigma factor (sigma-70 family)
MGEGEAPFPAQGHPPSDAMDSGAEQSARILQAVYPALVRTAKALGQPGEEIDLLHDSLVEVLARYPHFEGLLNPLAYTRVVLTRRVFAKRARAKRESLLAEKLAGRLEGSDSESDLAQADNRMALAQALKSLGGRQRACIYLRYIAGLDDSETSALLGCSRGTVRSQVARGLRRLRIQSPDLLSAEEKETSS